MCLVSCNIGPLLESLLNLYLYIKVPAWQQTKEKLGTCISRNINLIFSFKLQERKKSKEDPSASCPFRISSEGLPIILPHVTKQILHASPTDFGHLLLYKSRKFANFVNFEFGEKASKLEPGCCVVVLKKGQ